MIHFFASARSQLTILRALQFTNYALALLVITYFPLYFDSLGLSKMQIGSIYAIGPVLSILSNLVVGVISDRSKQLRRVLSLLFLGQILGLALLLPQQSYTFIALAMALFYFFQTPLNAMVDSVSLLAASQMKISFPAIRVFGSLGYALSAVLFGLLLQQYGSNMTLLLALIVVILSLFLSLVLGNFQGNLKKFEFTGLWKILRQRKTLIFFGLIILISIPHRINEGFLAIAMRNLGANDSLIGVASLISATSEIPTFFLLARYADRLKEIPLLIFAGSMYVVRLGLLSLATEPWMMVGLQAMHAVTFGIFYITAVRFMQLLLPDQFRSSGQALFAVVWNGVAGTIAGILGGWMIDQIGFSFAYQAGAAIALCGTVGLLVCHYRKVF